jgi:Uma2 family endonuclease
VSTVKKINHLSVDEYLEGEKHSGVRHEYVRGKVYAMVGTSKRHNPIAFGLASSIRSHLRGSPCRVFISDVKVRVDDVFYYPDILMTCAKTDIAEFRSIGMAKPVDEIYEEVLGSG